MLAMRRSNDIEVMFWEDQVNEAKEYYRLTFDDEQIKAYNEELADCETLEQIANVYNKYSDLLFDGSEMTVREI